MEANYEKCAHWVKEATEKGSNMICLPEHFAFHDKHSIRNNMTFNQSSPEELNLILDRYKELAFINRVWLSLGCFPETV
jgi:predicted amidohydrolase